MRASDRLPNMPRIDTGRASRRSKREERARGRGKVEIFMESKASSVAATRNPVSSERRSDGVASQRRNQIRGKFCGVLGECASSAFHRSRSITRLRGGSRYLCAQRTVVYIELPARLLGLD